MGRTYAEIWERFACADPLDYVAAERADAGEAAARDFGVAWLPVDSRRRTPLVSA